MSVKYFAGVWQQAESHKPDNVLSRTGMVIVYANCPIFWRSTLQMEIALSTAEADYIELSTALRQVIPLMTMVEKYTQYFPYTL